MDQSSELQDLVLPDGDKHKQGVSSVFDTVASGYDDDALRLFPLCADKIVSQLMPDPGWKILDVATGTGALAASLAQEITPDGRVTAIDLSEGMLACAESKIKRLGLSNVDFIKMDAEVLDFQSGLFDAVTCSFGLFFIPDMLCALRQWKMVTRQDGTVLFSSFTDNAFDPLVNIFIEDLEEFGLDVSEKMVSSARLKDAEVCRKLMLAAGFTNIEQNIIQVGYYLKDPDEWWTAIWNTAMRGLVEQLPQDIQPEFKRVHLKHVSGFNTDNGIWMDVEVRLTSGKVS